MSERAHREAMLMGNGFRDGSRTRRSSGDGMPETSCPAASERLLPRMPEISFISEIQVTPRPEISFISEDLPFRMTGYGSVQSGRPCSGASVVLPCRQRRSAAVPLRANLAQREPAGGDAEPLALFLAGRRLRAMCEALYLAELTRRGGSRRSKTRWNALFFCTETAAFLI